MADPSASRIPSGPVPRRRVLITGPAGFIGNSCAREFLARGADVVALVHHHQPAGLDGAELIHGGIDDRDGLMRALVRCGPFDAVVNCAGRATDVGGGEQFRRANYQGVLNLIDCVQAGAVGRLVQISSTDVYGLRDFQQADEATPLRDTVCNPYPKYKILAEQAIVQRLTPPAPPPPADGATETPIASPDDGLAGPRPRFVLLRPAAVWGPGDTSILPRVLHFLGQSSAIVHFGKWGGRNRWPLAHVHNVARAAWLAATCDEPLGQTYNVIDREFTTVEQFYRLLIAAGLVDQRPRKTVVLPFFIGWLAGQASSMLSNLLERSRPIFEPSLYGLYSACCNLDFSGQKLEALFARHGERFVDRATGLAMLAG